MRISVIIFLIITLVTFTNCTNSVFYPPAMQRAENYMNTRPDSALILLEAMADSVHTYPEETQMYWHLLIIQAKDKQYIPHTSDSLINRIVEFYENHGDKVKRMMSYYYQGRVYRDMNDAPRALKAFLRSEELKVTDKELLTKVYSQMGYLFAYQGLYDEAIKARRKSIDIYTNMGKENKASFAFRDIARMYKAKGQADSALYYYQKACQSALADNDQTKYDGILGELGNCYYSWGKVDKAKQLLLQVWNNNSQRSNTHIFPFLGYIYEQEQKWDSAIFYYNKALITKDLHKQVSALKGLSRIEMQSKGNLKKSFEYLNKALLLNDSIHDRIQTEAIAKVNSLYNYQHTEAENNRLKLEQEKQKVQLLGLLLVSLGSALAGILYFFRQREKRRKEQEAMKRFKKEAKDRYENSQKAIEINRKKIEELETGLAQAKEENDQLKAEQLRVQQKLLEARNEEIVLQQEEQKLRVEAFRRSDIYNEFLQASQSKGLNLASEKNIGKWEELEAAINTAYPDFMAKLHSLFPYLSDKESKVCMLAKTGTPPSGIAEIMKVSRQNITNIRTRIHQKIQNAGGDFDSFDQFIESL